MDEINIIRQNLNLLRRIVSKKVKLNIYDQGLCPFHPEKTNSFNIYLGKDRARFHCFGCGADGDIFNYLLRSEKLSFTLALMKLKYLIRNENDFSLSLPSLSEPAELVTNHKESNCFLSCQNYLNLKEDYEILLVENQELRYQLNLPNFQPNENLDELLNAKSIQ